MNHKLQPLFKIAAEACQESYKKNIDLGTTEYRVSFAEYGTELYQVISLVGTNEWADWIKNFDFWSKYGLKRSAVAAAEKVHALVKKSKDADKLMVTGHSKGGDEAIAYKKLFGADICVAFAPARCMRYWSNRVMEDTYIFIDPDDVVSKLGFLGFGHPVCERIVAPDDHIGLKISDHFMDRWVSFVG